MNTKFLWEHLNCRDIFGDVRVGNRNIKMNLREVLMKIGAEFRYGRIPLIRKLVILTANYPDCLGSSGKFVENPTESNLP